MKNRLLFLIGVLGAALLGLVMIAKIPGAAAATLVVDDDGVECPTRGYSSINAALLMAGTGDTIMVCAGTYAEDVVINIISLTLRGAQAGVPTGARMFSGPFESTVKGLITVQAANVTINGFSLTNSLTNLTQNNGILVKTAGHQAFITYNIISAVGSLTLAPNAQGIYLENGPDNVRIESNEISRIQSTPSAKGIYIGDTAATNASQNVLISGNLIRNITSLSRGAYGIQVNNRAGQPGLVISNNTIDTLTGGGWAHAIGLEGDTLNVRVVGNNISNVFDLTPVSGQQDAIAVFFEDNPSFGTAKVNQNNFDVTPAAYGIAVHPVLISMFPSRIVDGTCNWWDSADGPGPVGPGTGARVSPNVDFNPWLIAPAPAGACVGGASAPAKVTGGGQIPGDDPLFSPLGDLLSVPALIPSLADPNAQATFGFVAKCCPATGNLEYNDHQADVRIKAQSVEGPIIRSPGDSCPTIPGSKHATIGGRATVIRSTSTRTEDFTVEVDDCGEPGTADTFGIKTETYMNGWPVPKTLIGGNIQIRESGPGGGGGID
jgi:hypothetical protein